MHSTLTMTVTELVNLTESQSEQVHRLWNEEYPLNLRDRNTMLLEGVPYYKHFLIEDRTGMLLAWAVMFEKEGELRFSIIVRQDQQKKGLGSRLIQELKKNYMEFFGWVIDHNRDLKANGSKYTSPLAFYVKHGFEVLSQVRIDSEMISAVKIKWQNPLKA